MDRNVMAKVSGDQLKIELFLGTTAPGDILPYATIESKSGVKMDNNGKSRLRKVLDRMGIEFSPIRGYGVMLASAELVMPILSSRIIKIDSAVRRADKTHANLQKNFFDKLPADVQRQVLFAGAVFGAIRVAAENGRQLYGQNKRAGKGSDRIPLPG